MPDLRSGQLSLFDQLWLGVSHFTGLGGKSAGAAYCNVINIGGLHIDGLHTDGLS